MTALCIWSRCWSSVSTDRPRILCLFDRTLLVRYLEVSDLVRVVPVKRRCGYWSALQLGKWSALNESLPGRIFISYRRQETAWPAGRLYDVLVEHFPAEQVFKDVDNIEPGEDFVDRITAAVGTCDVLLALIGPQWLTITDEDGQPRLDNPEDYVRPEIAGKHRCCAAARTRPTGGCDRR
jgi:hypothetical protein